MNEKIQKDPWKLSFLCRLVLIPECYKDMLLSNTDIGFCKYILGSMVVKLYIRLELFLVLRNLKHLKRIYNSHENLGSTIEHNLP